MTDSHTDVQRRWVARVLGVVIPDNYAPSPKQAAPAPGTAHDIALRVMAIGTKLRAAGAPHDLVSELAAADAALRGHDLGVASGILDEIEALLASRARASEAAAAIKGASVSHHGGVVDFAKIRLAWSATREAREKAIEEMRTVCARMLEDPEVIEDPEYPDLCDASARVHELMPALPGMIDDLLDAMATEDLLERETARHHALDAIAAYLRAIDTVEGLKLLQTLPVGPADIYDQVAAALRALETALSD